MNMTISVNEQTLSQIQSLSSIELVDLTANVIQQLLNESGVEVSLENISMPNPSWMIYSDSISIEQPTAVNVRSLLAEHQTNTHILLGVTLIAFVCLFGIAIRKGNVH